MTTRGFSLRRSLVEKANEKAKSQNLSFSAYVRKLVGADVAANRHEPSEQAVNFATGPAEKIEQEAGT